MRRGSLFWGAVLIVFGVALLLDNLDLLPFPVWNVFWPAMLILAGVWTLWGVFFRRTPTAHSLSIPLEGATQGNVRLQHGAGRIEVGAGANSGELLSGSFDDVVHETRRDGEVLEARLRSDLDFGWRWPGDRTDWVVRLTREVPLRLEVNTGASEARLDLTEVRVTELNLKVGASSVNVTLPANAGMTKVSISAGAASVDVRIPEGVAARIRGRAGAGAISVDRQRFPRSGSYDESPDFAQAANRVEIDANVGAGAISIH
jgi:hypothetical protein